MLASSMWTRRTYNPNSLREQLKSLWKTKKMFNIKFAGQSLFLLSFESSKDMEFVLGGCPWLFQRQLVLLERLSRAVDREDIKLVKSPWWVKVGPCPPECDKKDLMHAMVSTFGGLMGSEVQGTFC